MKRIVVLVGMLTLFLTGCGSKDSTTPLKEVSPVTNNLDKKLEYIKVFAINSNKTYNIDTYAKELPTSDFTIYAYYDDTTSKKVEAEDISYQVTKPEKTTVIFTYQSKSQSIVVNFSKRFGEFEYMQQGGFVEIVEYYGSLQTPTIPTEIDGMKVVSYKGELLI